MKLQECAVPDAVAKGKQWVTPAVTRMEAGSAELNTNNAGPDGQGTFS